MRENVKVLRPGDARLSGLEPEPRPSPAPVQSKLTEAFIAEYDRTPTSHVRFRMKTEPEYAALVNEIEERRAGNAN